MTDKFLEEIREKISCPQFGDDHYGEWGILNVNQRRTIKRLIDYMDGQENYIKSQQAEIEELHKRVAHLDADREGWSRTATTQRLKNIELQAEIERLTRILGMNVAVVRSGRGYGKSETMRKIIDMRVTEVRAKAIKEFAERFKNSLKGYGGLYCRTTMNVRIDNLVKEMVGDAE